MSDKIETDGNSVLIGTPESARSIVSWQHNRYHHLQSLAQGLLGSILTALAITATVLAALDYNLPDLPEGSSVYRKAALEFPLDTTILAAKAVVLSNYLISVILAILSGIVLLAALNRLYTVIAGHPLETGVSSRDYISIVSEGEYMNLINDTGIKPLKSNYTQIIRDNQRQIEITNRIFIQAAMRTLTSLLLIVMASYIYWKVTIPKLSPLILLNLPALLPAPIVSNPLRRVLKIESRNQNTAETGIFQELFLNDESSRWEQLEVNWVEILLLRSIQVLSILSLLNVGVFYLNSLIS